MTDLAKQQLIEQFMEMRITVRALVTALASSSYPQLDHQQAKSLLENITGLSYATVEVIMATIENERRN